MNEAMLWGEEEVTEAHRKLEQSGFPNPDLSSKACRGTAASP
jgi:hypothetical protein